MVISSAPRADPSAIRPRPGTANRLEDGEAPSVMALVVVGAGSVVEVTMDVTGGLTMTRIGTVVDVSSTGGAGLNEPPLLPPLDGR